MTTTARLGTPQSRLGLLTFGSPLGTGAPSQLTLMMRALAFSIADAGLVENVHDYPVESITPPAVVVGYPTRWDFDSVYGQAGVGVATFPVWFACGKSGDESARNVLGDVMSGAASIKALLDATIDYDVRVTSAEVTELVVNAITYLAVRFDCEVLG
jgi:hypothetical protein